MRSTSHFTVLSYFIQAYFTKIFDVLPAYVPGDGTKQGTQTVLRKFQPG